MRVWKPCHLCAVPSLSSLSLPYQVCSTWAFAVCVTSQSCLFRPLGQHPCQVGRHVMNPFARLESAAWAVLTHPQRVAKHLNSRLLLFQRVRSSSSLSISKSRSGVQRVSESSNDYDPRCDAACLTFHANSRKSCLISLSTSLSWASGSVDFIGVLGLSTRLASGMTLSGTSVLSLPSSLAHCASNFH